LSENDTSTICNKLHAAILYDQYIGEEMDQKNKVVEGDCHPLFSYQPEETQTIMVRDS